MTILFQQLREARVEIRYPILFETETRNLLPQKIQQNGQLETGDELEEVQPTLSRSDHRLRPVSIETFMRADL